MSVRAVFPFYDMLGWKNGNRVVDGSTNGFGGLQTQRGWFFERFGEHEPCGLQVG